MIKILKQFDRDLVIVVIIILITFLILLFGSAPTLESQSMQSSGYYNQLFLAFARARVENKQHDAEILKALLMVQEHPSDKKKLAKICTQFVKNNILKDE